MNTPETPTVLLELTEEEAKMVLSAVWMRRESLKGCSPKNSQQYHDLMRKIEDQGVKILK